MMNVLKACVVLLLCSQAPASATNHDCPAMESMNSLFARIAAVDTGSTRTILTPEASEVYMAAYNAIPPVTTYPGDTVAFYDREGSNDIYLVMIVGDIVCRHGQIPRKVHDRAMRSVNGI